MRTDKQKELLMLPNDAQLQALFSGAKNSTYGINKVEARHLAYLGANIPTPGNVVEIGSHRGKSACCIASGILHAGKASTTRMHCVDLWTSGETTFAHYKSVETWKMFQAQVKAVGAQNLVRSVMMESVKASQVRRKPIHLLFIDAGHSFKAVNADWKAWGRFVAPGGFIAFHDFGTRFPGVDKTVQEVLDTNLFEKVGVFGRIWTGVRK